MGMVPYRYRWSRQDGHASHEHQYTPYYRVRKTNDKRYICGYAKANLNLLWIPVGHFSRRFGNGRRLPVLYVHKYAVK